MTAPRPAAPPPSLQDRLRAILQDHPFRASVFAVAVLMLFATVVLTPRYETNDDATMQLIVSGVVFANAPDEHLMFSNVLVGLPLAFLYRSAPDVPWYALYQLGTLAAAATAICYTLLRVSPTVHQAAVVLLFLVMAAMPCVVDVQFTKTAFLATFAGLLLLLAPLRGASPWPRAADVIGCVLIVWGSLIRFESLPPAVIMAAPVAAVAAYAGPNRAAWRAIPITVTLGLAVALTWFNTYYYSRSPGWEGFYTYNATRGEFTDFNRFKFSAAKGDGFREAGWEENDYWMLVNWFFADRERYSLEKMQTIAAAAPRNLPPSFWDMSTRIVLSLGHFPDLIRIMLVVVVGAFLTGSGWRRFALPASLFGLAVGLMLVLGVYYKLPSRVAFPLFIAALAGGALRPEGDDGVVSGGVDKGSGATETKQHSKGLQVRRTTPDNRKLFGIREGMRRAAGLAAGGLLIWSLWSLFEMNASERRFHSGMVRLVQALKPQPDQLFVLWREWFQMEKLVYPLEGTRDLRDFRCLWLSAQLATPISERRLRDFDIDDIHLAICERPNVFLVAMDALVRLFQIYVSQHYKLETAPVVVFPTLKTALFFSGVEPPKFSVYRVLSREKAPDKGATDEPKQ